jgi:hypothetical protein
MIFAVFREKRVDERGTKLENKAWAAKGGFFYFTTPEVGS